MKYKCINCGAIVTDYKPKFCCDGFMCGCRGLPIEPPLCESCEITDMKLQAIADRQ